MAKANNGNSNPLSILTTQATVSKEDKFRWLRYGLITVVSLVLAICFIVLGPNGDFVNGRAFSVSTNDEITYVFYNWTVSFPIGSDYEYSFQAWNTRLTGETRFVPFQPGWGFAGNRMYVNIETTARPDVMFKIDPWTNAEARTAGFGVHVSDRLPNTYGIDYANIVVYMPKNYEYKKLVWNTYPRTEHPDTIATAKWNLRMDNLTDAGMHFENVKLTTDEGSIHVVGISADSGTFNTQGGLITGEFTIPPARLHFNATSPF